MTIALLSGYPILGGAVAVLFRALQKSQEARIKERIADAEKLEKLLKAILDILRGNGDDDGGRP